MRLLPAGITHRPRMPARCSRTVERYVRFIDIVASVYLPAPCTLSAYWIEGVAGRRAFGDSPIQPATSGKGNAVNIERGDAPNVDVDTSALIRFAREVYTVFVDEIEPLLKETQTQLQGEMSPNERRGGSGKDGSRTLGSGGGEYAGTEIGKYHAQAVDDGVRVLEQTVAGLLAAAYGSAVFAEKLRDADGKNAEQLTDGEMKELWNSSVTGGAGSLPPIKAT